MCSEATVFIIDEDAATRDAVADLAGRMNLRCKTYASGLDFLNDCDHNVPGCVVMEARMMTISGLQIQRRLLSRGNTIPVMFLTAHADVPTIVRAMRNGATHFLEKPPREQELWDAIQQAIQVGEERLQMQQGRQELERRIASLTPRERQVLRMIGQDKPKKAIASDLGVCVRTVEIHRAKLMSKLEIKSLPALMRIAQTVADEYADNRRKRGGRRIDTGQPQERLVAGGLKPGMERAYRNETD